MKVINNKLEHELKIRTEKDFPKEGIEFIDITPLIIDRTLYNEVIDILTEEIRGKDIDYVIAPESRGFLFASSVAYNLNIGCIPVRKQGKLPPSVVEKTFDYEKEYGMDTLELPMLVDESYQNKKIYIVDDIYATGNTVNSIRKAVESSGGIVEGVGVILNIKELNNDEVFSIIDINEE